MQPRSLLAVREPRAGRPLGECVCIVYSSRYQISLLGLERLHPFDINKYARIYIQLVVDGLIAPEDVYVPEPLSREHLLRVHTPEYLRDLRRPRLLAKYLEAPVAAWLPAFAGDAGILLPFRYASGGTLLAARLALDHGMAVNLGGGYHHAEPDRGGGFCIYADMPIALRVLQSEGLVRRALFVDVDVHQGNGTARCVAAGDDAFTFDMFEKDIYPHPKQHNDIDVPLPGGVGDEEYLRVLSSRLPEAFERAAPDIVFYQAGVDSLAGDPLGHMRLSPEGIVRRDQIVFAEAARRKAPIVMTLGGGYSQQAWRVQCDSVRALIEKYAPGPRRAAVPGKNAASRLPEE